jgi:hypothetical protein
VGAGILQGAAVDLISDFWEDEGQAQKAITKNARYAEIVSSSI